MRLLVTLLFAFLIICATGSHGDERNTRPITMANTVLAVYAEDHGLGSRGLSKLIVAVWGDGHMVWTCDNLHGGGSYQSGKVAPEKVSALLKQLSEEKLFTDATLLKLSFGRDSKFTTIYVKTGKQTLKMSSWHELYQNDNVVATDAVLEFLNGRDRADMMIHVSPAYKRFRMTWDSVRGRIFALKPSKSLPVKGKIGMAAGIDSWIEWQEEANGG